VAHDVVPFAQEAQGEAQKVQFPLTRVEPAAQLEQKLLLEHLRQLFTAQVTQLVTPPIVVRTVLLAQAVQVLLGWQLRQLATLQVTQERLSVLGTKFPEHCAH
jgi:hypothetical protein